MKKIIAIVIIIALIVAARFNDHIYGLWVFYRIGRDITVNIEDDLEKARAAAYWVFDNIKGVERYAGFKNIDDNFMNVYRRRMGSCDQSAWAYVVMTNLLGLNSRSLFLIDDKGKSPHTVASVNIGGKTYIVDTTIHHMFDLSDKGAFKNYQRLIKEYCAYYYKNEEDYLKLDMSLFENGVYSYTLKEKIINKLTGKRS